MKKKKAKEKFFKAIEETRKDMIALELFEESQNVEDIEDDFNPCTWKMLFDFIKKYDEDTWINKNVIKVLEISESPHPEIYRDEETGMKKYVYDVVAILNDGDVISLTKETPFREAARNELQSILERMFWNWREI